MIARFRGTTIACALLSITMAPGADAAPARSAPAATLNVFAAASLAEAFGEIAREFERAHPGVRVQLNLAGSQQLVAQIEQGATADVFASADTGWMDEARDRALIAGADSIFARNRLIVIVPRTNPARIGRLQDLARHGVKLVLGAEAVPIGRYSREVLRNLSRDPAAGPDFATRVLANVVSEEDNVKSVVGKVQLGEADAGLVYRSDVTPATSRFVRFIVIPDSANLVASYPIAIMKSAPHPELARQFVTSVLSIPGQHAIERHGLIPVSGAAP